MYNKNNGEADTIFSVQELNFSNVAVVVFVMFVFPLSHFNVMGAVKVLMI